MNYNCDINIRKAYPPIMTEGKNEKYAKILMRLYAGRDSELTAIDQYLYQNIILNDEFSKIASVLEGISLVEMKHFRILGSLIKELGANPKMIAPSGSRRGCFWSGEYVNYSQSLYEILSADLTSEKLTVRDYCRAIDSVDDIYILDILSRIVEDEKHHIEILSNLLSDL